ncbi:hypothetical protein ESY86_00390 [Subsaximicrobium wynnwilliamsii]|jgi:parvulin-like peptidyl-prolyl isomerase|uniref:PpiC domain-containing protein n=1 Tax=Subsaximicrobium wynnwilliamsii TaxID=291179 RepID=A0A5C6ZR75_9FLAO|nr:peptidylprolyl isomerase [Subsaximicrobium wynnwilliamsii]TXD85047.1 hypothetical protein ESY87_01560 [Subsaximicrobium wynnwilliamsii]TXD91090.1 hypothetical protein ESY86_00390 [Subsaximicrobium wynnwilliamsii]TXE04484.1 hypothetical protein ESY88_03040 [Subsaximicrobium wynnwilliamsii]
MFKTLLPAACLLIATATFAQDDFEKSLDLVQTETDANTFLENNTASEGKVIVFNKEKHKTRLAKELFSLGLGAKTYDKNNLQPTYYKVIEKTSTAYYKASVIFFDASVKSLEAINYSRNAIISKYRRGVRFENLARNYSMDQTAKQSGDLGWITKGSLHPKLENAIFEGKHKVNDIFAVDVPETNAYYLVVITEAEKMIDEIKVLKVTEPL